VSELRAVEPLDRKRHRTDSFDCGKPIFDRWLPAYAGQLQRRDVARTFVAADADLNVIGYYTLVAGEVEHGAASSEVATGASRHFPIPLCLIARLAVDRSWQRRGLGRELLREAMLRALAASEQIGIRAIVVDAIDEGAVAFYRRHGFEPTTEDGLTLMVPIAAVRSRFGR
jgi:GNAT superfamily N-acetyltransferase